MVSEWGDELRERLAALLGADEVGSLWLLAGGASKEAWAVDVRTADGELPLLVRRAAGGVIHTDTLSLEDELRVLEAAHEGDITLLFAARDTEHNNAVALKLYLQKKISRLRPQQSSLRVGMRRDKPIRSYQHQGKQTYGTQNDS